jgi:hypothetical protein
MTKVMRINTPFLIHRCLHSSGSSMMIMLPDGLWVQRPGLPSCYEKDGFEGWCIPLTPETGEEVLPSPPPTPPPLHLPHPATAATAAAAAAPAAALPLATTLEIVMAQHLQHDLPPRCSKGL